MAAALSFLVKWREEQGEQEEILHWMRNVVGYKDTRRRRRRRKEKEATSVRYHQDTKTDRQRERGRGFGRYFPPPPPVKGQSESRGETTRIVLGWSPGSAKSAAVICVGEEKEEEGTD